VRIDVHGPEDRVKDASPKRMRRSLVPASGACALWRMPTTFPSSAPFGHPPSSARLGVAGDTATCWRTDQDPRSSSTPRRVPPSGRSGCLPPPRHAKELFSRRDCSLRPPRRLSRSRRPHFAPWLGTVFLIGHCKVTVRSPAAPWQFESTGAFLPCWNFVPGTDDPSTPPRSISSAVDEDRLPRSHRADRSA